MFTNFDNCARIVTVADLLRTILVWERRTAESISSKEEKPVVGAFLAEGGKWKSQMTDKARAAFLRRSFVVPLSGEFAKAFPLIKRSDSSSSR